MFWGGRGSTKSWSVARALICEAHTGSGAVDRKHRIGCFREYQTSIRDSVHQVLVQQIDKMGLTPAFYITDKAIISRATGSEFLFKGLHNNVNEIKSLEGLTRAWVEEAQSVSKPSWDVLEPTIRATNSEIWVTFNQMDEEDETYQRFVINGHLKPDCYVRAVTWEDNPWFPAVLELERRALLAAGDPAAYEWVWGTECRKISDAVIFKNRFEVCTFDEPVYGTRLFYGTDWGFANDPTHAVRCWEQENILHIDYEAVGYGVELDDLDALLGGGTSHDGAVLYPGVPGIKEWPVKGDCSRPETISYVRRQGYNIDGAEKWSGCVEDGITHLKGFHKIRVHERCKHIAREFRLYSFKVDKNTQQVLPIIVDKHNHGIDATRYALDGYIQKRGGLGVWEQLGRQA